MSYRLPQPSKKPGAPPSPRKCCCKAPRLRSDRVRVAAKGAFRWRWELTVFGGFKVFPLDEILHFAFHDPEVRKINLNFEERISDLEEPLGRGTTWNLRDLLRIEDSLDLKLLLGLGLWCRNKGANRRRVGSVDLHHCIGRIFSLFIDEGVMT